MFLFDKHATPDELPAWVERVEEKLSNAENAEVMEEIREEFLYSFAGENEKAHCNNIVDEWLKEAPL